MQCQFLLGKVLRENMKQGFFGSKEVRVNSS